MLLSTDGCDLVQQAARNNFDRNARNVSCMYEANGSSKRRYETQEPVITVVLRA